MIWARISQKVLQINFQTPESRHQFHLWGLSLGKFRRKQSQIRKRRHVRLLGVLLEVHGQGSNRAISFSRSKLTKINDNNIFLFYLRRKKFSESFKKTISILVAGIILVVYHASWMQMSVRDPLRCPKSHTKRLLVSSHFHRDIEISNSIRLLLATLY